jgi:hypothetical protein
LGVAGGQNVVIEVLVLRRIDVVDAARLVFGGLRLDGRIEVLVLRRIDVVDAARLVLGGLRLDGRVGARCGGSGLPVARLRLSRLVAVALGGFFPRGTGRVVGAPGAG